MKCLNWIAATAGLVGLAGTGDALAVGTTASVRLIDRDSGAALATHYFQGEYWVAGKPGARYAIEIRNSLGGRLLAVVSVDGVNVLSGAGASWDQTGYVFEAGERYQITGWRKSHTEVAAFTFTDRANSYAERTGRPDNVGVIGVALFRERTPVPSGPPKIAQRESGAEADEARTAPSGAPPTTASRALAPAPGLGTGHGEREYSYVADTEFVRLQSQPNEVIRIRYDSLEHLVALGVVRRPHPALPVLNPFPASPERAFVPDPPG
jgi:hypothetical protein